MTQPKPGTELEAAVGSDWETLVRRLLLHARTLGVPLEEAEDLVQDTIEKWLRNTSWYDRNKGSLLGALKAILRNRAIDRHRATGVRQRKVTQLKLVEPQPTPADVLQMSRARSHRHQFLALLTPVERNLFRVWLQQRRGEVRGVEAAARMGMSPATYEAAKKRLRRRCGDILEDLGIDGAELYDGEA